MIDSNTHFPSDDYDRQLMDTGRSLQNAPIQAFDAGLPPRASQEKVVQLEIDEPRLRRIARFTDDIMSFFTR